MADAFNVQFGWETATIGMMSSIDVTWNKADVRIWMTRSFDNPEKKRGCLKLKGRNTTTAAETPQAPSQFPIATYELRCYNSPITPVSKDENNADDYKFEAIFKPNGDIECDMFVAETDSGPQSPSASETNKTSIFKTWARRVKNVLRQRPPPKPPVRLLWARDPAGGEKWALSERRAGKPYSDGGILVDRVLGRFNDAERAIFVEPDRGRMCEYAACVMLAMRLLRFHENAPKQLDAVEPHTFDFSRL